MQKKCILVIEDEQAVRQGIVDALEEEGFRVLEEGDGDSGLKAALHTDCNLVLLDLLLPQMSGLEVLKNIREERPTLPVIILTGQSEEVDRIEGLNLGADDYVVKPFSVGELLARVAAVLRRSPERSQNLSHLKIPNGEVNLKSSRVELDNGEISDLSERECELLKYLVTNAGRIVSREEILTRVWQMKAEGVNTRTIDMHIVRLREKLSDCPNTPAIIKTIRGQGYMFTLENILHDESDAHNGSGAPK